MVLVVLCIKGALSGTAKLGKLMNGEIAWDSKFSKLTGYRYGPLPLVEVPVPTPCFTMMHNTTGPMKRFTATPLASTK